ncbi:uncharacterized protein LAJ45_03086 [Morchella importuna]|uniref:uncharacterized protein n=1 Tax=Morchella importuna TaxID=1174673 RepID=UPI001E8E062E|nr:uncharacterized protein LAJ45_03086 [Morchella importuna]KAH8152860.1 hypothetical protein LAJ45_03086 [Morchella importuna]
MRGWVSAKPKKLLALSSPSSRSSAFSLPDSMNSEANDITNIRYSFGFLSDIYRMSRTEARRKRLEFCKPEIKLHPKSSLTSLLHSVSSQGGMLNGDETSTMKDRRRSPNTSNKPSRWEWRTRWLSTSDSLVPVRRVTLSNYSGGCQNEVSNHVFISHLFVEETIQSLEPTYPESIRLTGRSDQKPLVVSNLEIASTLCPAPAPRASRKLFLDRNPRLECLTTPMGK